MVFSSLPAYLDQSNWQHVNSMQQNHQIIGSSSSGNPLLLPPHQPTGLHPSPPSPQTHGGPGGGSIRPGSMSERARLANIPLPEAALKCPRCESTNTKFCYFNNYNLSQPRHFCKTCRRYWTRGGALRSVPVGGGCRRNKRSKSSSSSKSPAASGDNRQTNNNNNDNNNNNPSSTISSMNNPTINSGSAANLLGLGPQFTPLRFMSPLSHLTVNFASDNHVESNHYGGIMAPAGDTNFLAANNLFGVCSIDGGSNIEPWRLPQVQQFPFLDQSSAGTYQYHGLESNFMTGGQTSHHHDHHQARPKLSGSTLSQISSAKMERNPELNLSRQLLGNMNENEQWNPSTSNWTDLSSFTSSSTSNHL